MTTTDLLDELRRASEEATAARTAYYALVDQRRDALHYAMSRVTTLTLRDWVERTGTPMQAVSDARVAIREAADQR